ncbi:MULTISPECIES: hypothetical protein [Rhodococcus]|uniref:Glycosyl transferase family 28 C-terminal domain-containing protein n=1 Tax=Rhodococcus opacus RKJ300 = JCM 13270 TaxID=1165867 RepID=I0WM16_RHOOP|nr:MULTISPECIES: hypothetical protein [Rhodococcus]EID77432.1 hypothetical protein W59_23820 [Rhodococcus opacus RKJ300 = JCM 13270]QQZ18417.1 hypothetical protein GO592_40225 [Rhodococcus sp. 21391]
MTIVYAPNPTGTGHNMRALAIAAQVRELKPEVEQTVLLGSMQDTFRPMFAEAKVEVVDIAPKATNTALHSHLSDRLDWENMVSNYLVPTFLNGDRILRMLGHFRDVDTEIVVSDYNPVAGIAAHIAGLPHVLVTERFNFSLVNVTNDQLVKGGAEVDSVELDRARAALDQVFRLITSTAAAVVTDKPSLPNYVLDKEFRSLEENGKAQFVGPIIRPLPSGDARAEGKAIREKLGLGEGPVIVATVGGTTMHLKNKQALIDCYLDVYERLRGRYPALEMVLIGREKIDVPPGVHSLDYLPDWMPLIRDAALLLVPPGWITVTEICALGIPAVFVLSSYSEYHEIEPFERLTAFGFVTHLGTDAVDLAVKAEGLINSPNAVAILREKYRVVAPDPYGAQRVAQIVLSLR